MFLVLTGTSFAGKSTMQKSMVDLEHLCSKKVKTFKTCTTRKKRRYEKQMSVDALPYHFLSEEAFAKSIEANDFFEYVIINKGEHDDYYGSRYADISDAVASKEFLYVAVFEPEGATKIKEQFPETMVIFIEPPSISELIRRAEIRNTETIADVRARIERVENIELKYADTFDFKVINIDKDKCFTDICNHITNYINKNNI